MWFLVAVAIAALLLPFHIVGMALASSAVGADLVEVRIFFGPGLTLRRESPKIRIGCLPFGGYVQSRGQHAADAPGEPGRFEDLARWRQLLVFLSGNAVLLVIAAVLLGPGDALASFARAPVQLLSLALDRTSALAAVNAFASLGASPTMVGVVAAKLAAFNLLPFAGLNGWMIVRLAIPLSRRASLERSWTLASSLILLALLVLGGMTLLRA